MSDAVRTGGCQCGGVRFRIRGELGRPSICHCRMCQKQFGSFFSALVTAPAGGVEWIRDEPSYFQSSVNIDRDNPCTGLVKNGSLRPAGVARLLSNGTAALPTSKRHSPFLAAWSFVGTQSRFTSPRPHRQCSHPSAASIAARRARLVRAAPTAFPPRRCGLYRARRSGPCWRWWRGDAR